MFTRVEITRDASTSDLIITPKCSDRIARALYHDPEVIILDEATSALDNRTERGVMEAVHNLSHSKTVILIAHRLTTIQECDQIYVLERGRIVGCGSYDQLMASNEIFRQIAGAIEEADRE